MTTTDALLREASAVELLGAAARTVRRTGLVVRVVLERRAGVASQLRLAAEREGVRVSIELRDTSVIGRFAADSRDG